MFIKLLQGLRIKSPVLLKLISYPEIFISDTDYCDIKEINGFLKYSCLDKDSSGIGDNATRLGERHKCPFSNQSYYKYTIQIFQQLAGR